MHQSSMLGSQWPACGLYSTGNLPWPCFLNSNVSVLTGSLVLFWHATKDPPTTVYFLAAALLRSPFEAQNDTR